MEHLGFEPIPQGVTLIRESDVYRLVMRSKLESAERFQDWVVEEVLPTIRATGSYSLKTPAEEFDDVLRKQKELLEKGDFFWSDESCSICGKEFSGDGQSCW